MKQYEIGEENSCTGCGLCLEICPQKCITMNENIEGFMYPQIDKNKCIGCNLCQKFCPNNKDNKLGIPKYFMAINKNKEILKKSSSGGAFSAISNIILENKGIIVGASMDKDTKQIKHIIVDNEKDLDLLRLSKYYQSETSGIFTEVLNYLKKGKQVLFSGTACQIAALLAFVPNNFQENLITVDVLCHGVSNKKIVDAYIISEEKRFNKSIVNYKFRIKEETMSWHSGGGSKMKLFFSDGSSYIEKKKVDSFYMAFNNNIILRNSCYNCKYCGTNRISDFTLADFWGVTDARANQEMKKDGISLLVCNSEKSKNLIENLKNNLYLEEIDSKEVIPFNRAFIEPNLKPSKRKLFFKYLNNGMDFRKILNKIYWKVYLKMYIKNLLGEKNISKIKKIGRKLK